MSDSAQKPNISKLEAIDAKLKALKAQKEAILARANKKERAEDTRAKIIIGGHFLAVARKGPEEAKKLLASLEKADLRDSDKKSLEKIFAELKASAEVKKAESSKP